MSDKEREEKQKKVLELLSKDTFTKTEICEKVGITRKTLWEWETQDPEFAAKEDEMRNELMSKISAIAKVSLRRLVEGYVNEETTIISVPSKTKYDPNGNPLPVIKEQKTIRKPVPPNTGAVIFALTNVDPDNWKNRQEFTGNTKLTHEYSADDIPDDVLRKVANAMQEAESKRERERRGL